MIKNKYVKALENNERGRDLGRVSGTCLCGAYLPGVLFSPTHPPASTHANRSIQFKSAQGLDI